VSSLATSNCYQVGGLKRPWSRIFQVLWSCKRRIQAGCENVVKVIIKFIDSKGKATKERKVSPGQVR
jgi:hypothetical protein